MTFSNKITFLTFVTFIYLNVAYSIKNDNHVDSSSTNSYNDTDSIIKYLYGGSKNDNHVDTSSTNSYNDTDSIIKYLYGV